MRAPTPPTPAPDTTTPRAWSHPTLIDYLRSRPVATVEVAPEDPTTEHDHEPFPLTRSLYGRVTR